MADQTLERAERKIPVFTVWKSNVILKNIFLVYAPPSIELEPFQETQNHKTHQEFEEILTVGRHPDCDIRLEHPSVSRFHLRIHSVPSSTQLFIIDLSSVHGTWVSGKRIEPNVKTRLNETDTLKIGGSSRIYKLHWIPFSQAYDMEHPFVPPLDFPEPLEDGEEDILKDENFSGSKDEDGHLGMNDVHSVQCENDEMVTNVVIEDKVNTDLQELGSLFGDENSDPSLEKNEVSTQAPQIENEDSQVPKSKDSDSESSFQDAHSEVTVYEGLGSLFEDENSDTTFEKEIITQAPEIQNENSQLLIDKDSDSESSFQDANSEASAPKLQNGLESSFEDQNSEVSEQKEIPMDSVLDGLMPLFMGENWEWVGQESHLASPAKEYIPLPAEYEDGEVINSTLAHESIADLVQKLDSTMHEDAENDAWNFWDGSLVEPEEVLSDAENQFPRDESETKVLSERRCLGRIDVRDDDDDETEDNHLWSFWSGDMGVESVCSSLSEAEHLSSKKQFGSPLLTSEQNSARSIWSRRGKQASAPQILTTTTKESRMKTTRGKVNDEPLISRALFHGVDDQEDEEKEEVFTPNKENFTPNTHRSMRKMAVLKEAKYSNSGKSSALRKKMVGSPDVYYEGDCASAASDKENYSPKALQKQKTGTSASLKKPLQTLQLKERKTERRVPFQPLLTESPQKNTSEICIPDAAIRSGKSSINCEKITTKTCLEDRFTGVRPRKWNMVVDTTTLLNKESRKALQLLAGLKGTQLIIPRIVIRELDCLKRQVSFFRRNSEVLSALEWIQDCMATAETQWWVHVQTSMEEGRAVAPTPPASPHSHFSSHDVGTATSASFFEPRAEILSPTAEDHVLDYALCFRKARNDGQLVLLSNDITLKIKAMAEGIICEEAEEFRESLVNPFSERFLWADSSPRGQTWSCSDDIVLREKFYPSSMKIITPKAMENPKGLKLVLLHNSQYFERMTMLR